MEPKHFLDDEGQESPQGKREKADAHLLLVTLVWDWWASLLSNIAVHGQSEHTISGVQSLLSVHTGQFLIAQAQCLLRQLKSAAVRNVVVENCSSGIMVGNIKIAVALAQMTAELQAKCSKSLKSQAGV